MEERELLTMRCANDGQFFAKPVRKKPLRSLVKKMPPTSLIIHPSILR